MFFKEFLAESRHLAWPLVALVLFFVVFLAVVFRLVRGMVTRQSFDHVAALPLEDDPATSSRGGSKP